MNYKTWLSRMLTTLFSLGTLVAGVLWVEAVRAKCEGFGCLGVGP